MSKKLTPEEELEKQYRDYKGQFEQWKERNKGSFGTDAYNSYVKQFQEWEKDVEKRRKALKEKATTEESERIRLEQEAKDSKMNEAREAEAAAAYAASQQAYLAHHQKAMEQAEMTQRVAAAQQQQRQFMQSVVVQQQQIQQTETSVNADNVMREVMNVMMVGTATAVGSTINQQQPPPAAAAPPPSLWGNVKVPYDGRDPLFSKWGLRASPSHHKPDASFTIKTIPHWLLLDTLSKKKMMLAPDTNVPPPVFNSSQPPPPIVSQPPPQITPQQLQQPPPAVPQAS